MAVTLLRFVLHGTRFGAGPDANTEVFKVAATNADTVLRNLRIACNAPPVIPIIISWHEGDDVDTIVDLADLFAGSFGEMNGPIHLNFMYCKPAVGNAGGGGGRERSAIVPRSSVGTTATADSFHRVVLKMKVAAADGEGAAAPDGKEQRIGGRAVEEKLTVKQLCAMRNSAKASEFYLQYDGTGGYPPSAPAWCPSLLSSLTLHTPQRSIRAAQTCLWTMRRRRYVQSLRMRGAARHVRI